MVKYILATKEETYEDEVVFCVSAKEKLLSFEEAKQMIISNLEKTLESLESKESLYSLAIERWGDFNDDIVIVQEDHEMCDMLQCMYLSHYIKGNSIAFPKSGKWAISQLEAIQLKYQNDIMVFKESIQRIKDCTEENFHSLCDIEGNYRDSYYIPIMIEE